MRVSRVLPAFSCAFWVSRPWARAGAQGSAVPWHVMRKCPLPPGLSQVCWPCLARNAKSCCPPFCDPFLPLGVAISMRPPANAQSMPGLCGRHPWQKCFMARQVEEWDRSSLPTLSSEHFTDFQGWFSMHKRCLLSSSHALPAINCSR